MIAFTESLNTAKPLRRCIVSGKSFSKEALVRFVVGPNSSVVPDIKCKLGGRGMWVGIKRGLLEEAIQQNLFRRAAKTNVKVRCDLVELVDQQLCERVLNGLSLAKKAGQAVCGYTKVSLALKKRCALLLVARDASENAQSKVCALAKNVDCLRVLTSNELGAAFSKPTAVQAAVSVGGLAELIKIDGRRLAEFRNKGSLDEDRHDAKI